MKEHPITFKGDMVKAILQGRKTQTRRIIQPQPPESTYWDKNEKLFMVKGSSLGLIRTCPYGLTGDRLWLKETWAVCSFSATMEGQLQLAYKILAVPSTHPDGMTHALEWREVDSETWQKYTNPKYFKWQSPRFMPRFASRIDLENVIDPYPQRLKEISEEDAIAEGIRRIFIQGVPWFYITESGGPSFERGREAFAALWDPIHGPDSWDRNEWVWVNTFKRI